MNSSASQLTSDSRPAPTRPNDIKGRDLGDEYLFYDRGRDQVHVLNGTAREIYLLCDGRRCVGEVVKAFLDRYEIDEGMARTATHDTIRDLVALGLLSLS